MTPHFPIYMDYGATTPVDPRVVDAMVPWLREHFGNPASRSHAEHVPSGAATSRDAHARRCTVGPTTSRAARWARRTEIGRAHV